MRELRRSSSCVIDCWWHGIHKTRSFRLASEYPSGRFQVHSKRNHRVQCFPLSQQQQQQQPPVVDCSCLAPAGSTQLVDVVQPHKHKQEWQLSKSLKDWFNNNNNNDRTSSHRRSDPDRHSWRPAEHLRQVAISARLVTQALGCSFELIARSLQAFVQAGSINQPTRQVRSRTFYIQVASHAVQN